MTLTTYQMIVLSVVVGITGVFAILRFVLPVEGKINKKDFYKNFAHLWVGGLFGTAFAMWDRWEYWVLAVGLTVIEIIAFIVRKKS